MAEQKPQPWFRYRLETFMVKMLLSIESALLRIFVWLVYFVYTVIIVTTFVSVFFRYILNDSLVWAEELARYLFVWLTFIGSALALKEGLHMGVDLLLSALPGKLKTMLEIVINCLIAAFLIFSIKAGITVVQITMGNRSSALEIPMGFVYLAIPVGCSLMLLISCRKIFQLFSPAHKNGETHASQPIT
jgi:TRAP-type C4-dicarboxylate transport system permease small subunit